MGCVMAKLPLFSFKSQLTLKIVKKYLNTCEGVEKVVLIGSFDDAYITFLAGSTPFSVDYQYGELQFFCDLESQDDSCANNETVKQVVESLKNHPIRSCFLALLKN